MQLLRRIMMKTPVFVGLCFVGSVALGSVWAAENQAQSIQMAVPPVFASSGFDQVFSEDVLIPIVGMIGSFSFVSAIVAMALYSRNRRDQRRFQALQQMIDKGLPIPPDLLASPAGSDLRRGVILISTGLGVALFFKMLVGATPGLWTIGGIFVFIGLGYLLAWKLEGKQSKPGSAQAT
jgi:hypothetical protein